MTISKTLLDRLTDKDIIPAAALLAAGCSDPATPEAADELGPLTGMPDGTAETGTPGDTPSGEPETASSPLKISENTRSKRSIWRSSFTSAERAR